MTLPLSRHVAARTSRVALLVDDSRLDPLATRQLLLAAHTGFGRLEWLDASPGAEVGAPFDRSPEVFTTDAPAATAVCRSDHWQTKLAASSVLPVPL